jgi:hypothetical protein
MPTASEPAVEPGRRSFLKKGLLGGALLAVGGLTVTALRKGKPGPAPERPLVNLPVEVFPIAVAVVARLIPKPEGAVEHVYVLDAGLANLPPAVAADFIKIFGLLENGLAGLLTRGSATPFTLLDAAGQDAALGAWRDSPVALLTSAYNAIRKMTLGSYYADLARARAFGYLGPAFEKPGPGPELPRGPLSAPFIVGGPHPELGANNFENRGENTNRGEVNSAVAPATLTPLDRDGAKAGGAAPTGGRRGGAPLTGQKP